MLPRSWTRGRRRAVIGASAAVVCAGAVVAGYAGGGADDGYVAVGAGGGPSGRTAVAPTEGVRLVPLDGAGTAPGADNASRGVPSSSPPSRAPEPAPGTSGALGPTSGVPATPSVPDSGPPSADGASPGHTETPSRPPTPSPTPAAPAAPAALTVGTPVREPTDKRWCEKVTVAFHNTGGTAVRSGTVTFGTHIIGVLGIDWGTIESTEALPAPIAPGARTERTWTVCVESWRVPLGMHIETRDVSVEWE
ncbi:hypothetical protein SSP24_63670 [Streptomyces spinoverrucosus]|uniref:CBM2 domain-containing protein n=1 Tax=Streptomyces spinoverrucosus TaxID=284043 RepID=A0A4Y3VNW9_9ACTN|nr:hypothetical protein [Streptomyces spinoverrucosus]GEC08712.1 hypothetical protein SSP24_63670 [Streptomyces spinoverrucosus]GHB64395.1 hypothetical protein GCM10010397_38140 [Streptomyces spinoverrucosus]